MRTEARCNVSLHASSSVPCPVTRQTDLLHAHQIPLLVGVRSRMISQAFFKARHAGQFQYDWVTIDANTVPVSLARARAFVEKCLLKAAAATAAAGTGASNFDKNNAVLFYDETGDSRAAMLVSAYLMDARSLSFMDGEDIILRTRYSVSLPTTSTGK